MRFHAEGIWRVLADDPQYAAKAREFSSLMRDVTEFLASIELNPDMAPINATVTYQDSCHLAHGQRIRTARANSLPRSPG